MPVDNGIGHSAATLSKQEGLRHILELHLKLCNGIISRWGGTYQYVDTNAGSGANPEGCPGSPVVFLNAARTVGISYRAHLIELDPGNALMLRGVIGQDDCTTVYTGDNADVVPSLLATFRPGSFGLIYSDPNSHSDEDFDLLGRISTLAATKKMDILLRYTAAATKRAGRERLLHALERIEKPYKLVRSIERNDRWQWTFILLTEWAKFPEYRKEGFYRADSTEGEGILHRLHYTGPELKALYQPSLPYADYGEYLRHPQFLEVRGQVMDRSGGT